MHYVVFYYYVCKALFLLIFCDPERLLHHHPLSDECPENPRVLAAGPLPRPVPTVVDAWGSSHVEVCALQRAYALALYAPDFAFQLRMKNGVSRPIGGHVLDPLLVE